MHRSDLGWTWQWNEADGVATTAKASSAVTMSIRHRFGGFQASATVPDGLQVASSHLPFGAEPAHLPKALMEPR